MDVSLQNLNACADSSCLELHFSLTLLKHSRTSSCPMQMKFGSDFTSWSMTQVAKFQPNRRMFGGETCAQSGLF